jgi:formate hydrogenlyase subunit 3/multisubunit Na+/H+ antiporter MnhD subunit
MMTPEQAIAASISLCLAGAALTLLIARNRLVAGWVAFAITACSAALICWAVVQVFTKGPGHPAQFLTMPAVGFALRIHVDGLTSVFLLLAAFVAVWAAFYSIRYMDHYADYGVARYYPNFLLFLAAMYGLLSTTDMMWFFFIFWQMMTLPGYALIRFEYRKPENIRAANKYLIMMQIACVATMAGAELISFTGGTAGVSNTAKYDFDTVSAHLPALLAEQPLLTGLAFALFLVGFGIKMGMWPFGQVWLPDAHPAAPSPVSAMLSGVMLKTGVYGLMRYFLWLVPAEARGDFPLTQWGLAVVGLGAVTMLTGTFAALRQTLTKRLLAFSSIGQIGYILLGLGVCMMMLGATEFDPAAALAAAAFSGALFHTLNHGLFKSLLFLNAGSVLQATGTQELDKLGGLMRFMPWTAVTALIASLSIAGTPLLNGFASKWSIYIAAIQGAPVCGLLPLLAMVAIFTSALTLALFIKFFGGIFLSRTSTTVAARAAGHPTLEVGGKMLAAQAVLAAGCVLFGLLPFLPLSLIDRALDASRHGFGSLLADASAVRGYGWSGVIAGDSQSLYAPLAVAATVALMFALARRLARLGCASRRTAAPWLCGYASEAEIHRYRPSGFYSELTRLLDRLDFARRRAGPPPVAAVTEKTKEPCA